MITSQYLLLLPLIVLIYTQLRLDRTRHALLILVAAIIFLASGIYDLVIISLLLSITWFGIRISEKKLSSKKIYLIALIALEITPLLINKFLKLGWFHEALAEELTGTGVKVTALCPGLTDTNMVSSIKAQSKTAQWTPSFLISDPKSVAKQAYRALMAGQTILVPGLPNQIAAAWSQVTPRWLTRTFTGLAVRQADWMNRKA